MERFEFAPTLLAGLLIVERHRIEDDRGFLTRFFSADQFARVGFDVPIARGIHAGTCPRT